MSPIRKGVSSANVLSDLSHGGRNTQSQRHSGLSLAKPRFALAARPLVPDPKLFDELLYKLCLPIGREMNSHTR